MSDSYDRSHYEIALTNGQVLVALGIILSCVVGAFLSGLWVARKAMGGEQSVPAEAVAQAEPPGEAFEFFGDSKPVGDEPNLQQLRPIARRPPKTEARGQAPPAKRAENFRSSAPLRDPSAGAEIAAAQEPDTTLQNERSEPAPLAEVPVVQVFSSNDENQANGLVERLRNSGYRAYLSAVEIDGRNMYRVRVGPFTNRPEAKVQADKIKREFKLDTWITSS